MRFGQLKTPLVENNGAGIQVKLLPANRETGYKYRADHIILFFVRRGALHV
jgi:hypothetical protein